MKTFKVEGWYRYSNGNEKDFEQEVILAKNPKSAINIFKAMFNINFFSIDIKLVS